MITREEWKGLNFRKLNEHLKELEEYDGEIPLVFYEYINIINRVNYLNSRKKQYEYSKIGEYRKRNDTDKDIDEIIKFVNENEEFVDIIKIKK